MAQELKEYTCIREDCECILVYNLIDDCYYCKDCRMHITDEALQDNRMRTKKKPFNIIKNIINIIKGYLR